MAKENKKENINEAVEIKPKKKIKDKFSFNMGYIFLVVMIIVVFVFVNIIAAQLPLTFDFSSNEMYTISEATENLLDEIPVEVEIIALYDKVQGLADKNLSDVIRLLDVYDSHKNVNVSYVSLNDNPNVVNENVGDATAGTYSEGDYIVKSNIRTKRIAASEMFETQMDYTTFTSKIVANKTEKEVTNAIKYVTNEQIPTIYVSTGFLENDRSEYSYIFDDIDSMNMDVADINLNQAKEIPENADAIVFLSPKADLSTSAYEMLHDWLANKGGMAIFAFDSDMTATKFDNFNLLLKELYGMEINNDIVSDIEDYQITSAGKPSVISAGHVANGPISSESGNALKTTYTSYDSRSISVLGTSNTYASYPLIQTSKNATSTEYVTGKEVNGVQSVVACGEWKFDYNNISKAVVFGSSKGLMDEYIRTYSDTASEWLFLYSIDWLIGETAMDTVEGVEARVDITDKVVVDVTQSRWLFVFSVIIYPLVIIGVGIFVWMRRRHL